MPQVSAESRIADTPSVLLAIDTSTEQAGVALFDGERLDQSTWFADRNHTVTTLAEIDHVLDRAGIEIGAVQAVAVATGPGSFSALRVGLSIAKGLVFAQGIPVMGVPTLDAIASLHSPSKQTVVAALRVGRGRVVWGHYDINGSKPMLLEGPVNSSLEELESFAHLLNGSVLVAGIAPGDSASSLRFAPLSTSTARVSAVALLGWRRWQSGQVDDPIKLEPIYLHAKRNAVVGAQE